MRVARPDFEEGPSPIRLVDLFSGCGGLSLGVAQAAEALGRGFRIPLAVDRDETAVAVFAQNFETASTRVASIEELLDGCPGGLLTRKEKSLRSAVGSVDFLVGGPPCQGHSDLNNHTRRIDPKNVLYETMGRAAEVFRPRTVLVENVPSVRRSKRDVVSNTRQVLIDAGYTVADEVLSLVQFGVPQMRRRHILIATANGQIPASTVMDLLATSEAAPRDVRWAIGDLDGVAQTENFDKPARASEENRKRMQWLIDNDEYDLPNRLRPPCHQKDSHSYKSMYGRLQWNRPAQTITSGFGSIGQGRYMHPRDARALTPHEAARIQGFPDYFSFDGVDRRSDLACLIANAVPPALSKAVVEAVLGRAETRTLPASGSPSVPSEAHAARN